MTAVQQWGRKESIIWPPRGFYYTYGAIFLAIVATGFLSYVHFEFALSSLQQYYLPYYLRTETAGLTHPASMYQLVYVTDGQSRTRIALDADVRAGETPQLAGRPLPFVLSAAALAQGFRYLAREPMRPYQNRGLHTWIAHWIYADTSPTGIFATPLYCGILALTLQLPFSIHRDIRRRKELRYGRRLKGP
ncbi:MAG: ArsR family transcriptional regulator, partial [Candidatus Sulfotelmatobacter sp.]